MPRARSWNDVWLGAVALALVAAGAAAVLVFARVGALRGTTIRLYAVTPHARGILPGSEVWLAGRRVGVVRSVGFRSPGTDTSLRVILALDVLAGPGQGIRRAAPVAIRAGGSLIGAPVVAISPGIPTTPAAARGRHARRRPGQRARIDPHAPHDDGRDRGAGHPRQHPRPRRAAAHRTRNAGGARRRGAAADRRHRVGCGPASRPARRAATAPSGASFLATSPPRARAALARVGELKARASSPDGTVGRLRTDSSLARSARAVRADLAEVQALLAEPRGTAGRITQDRVLQLELARARAELDLLVADAARNPLRYVRP
jgi:hypothetical protein